MQAPTCVMAEGSTRFSPSTPASRLYRARQKVATWRLID